MPTTFVKGDLFGQLDLDGLAHGCNCAGAMGRGIAVEFRKRFPEMYAEYKRRCADGQFNLGDVFVWRQGGITVFNLGTQKTWRTKADLVAVKSALQAMVELAAQAGVERIGLPRIGAGLGGLAWRDVRAALAVWANRRRWSWSSSRNTLPPPRETCSRLQQRLDQTYGASASSRPNQPCGISIPQVATRMSCSSSRGPLLRINVAEGSRTSPRAVFSVTVS